jgi:hypothetical protein
MPIVKVSFQWFFSVTSFLKIGRERVLPYSLDSKINLSLDTVMSVIENFVKSVESIGLVCR